MSDFKSVVAEVKARLNIVQFFEDNGIVLKPAGVHRWKGLCPFHVERTPSFVVDENFQNYKCFGCGVSGDVLQFVVESEQLSFVEALRGLADLTGVEFDPVDSVNGVSARRVRQVLSFSHRFFVKCFELLPDSHAAKRMVLDRGLPLDGLVYGYAPESRSKLADFLLGKGFSVDEIVAAGVCRSFDGSGLTDFWHGRLMFTICDAASQPVGFSGRRLFDGDSRGKYVNSPDGLVFHKSRVLFHHEVAKGFARERERVFVAEGQFDVAAIVNAGFGEVVASSGTAFTVEQLNACARMVGDGGRIVFCFDGDDAGLAAVVKVFESAGVLQSKCFVVCLPDGLDPCDFAKRESFEELARVLENGQVSIVDFMISVLRERASRVDGFDSDGFVRDCARVLAGVHSLSLRERLVRQVAFIAMVSTSVVEQAVAGVPVSSPVVESVSDVGVDCRSVDGSREGVFVERVLADDFLMLQARLVRLAMVERSLAQRVVDCGVVVKPFKHVASQLLEFSGPVVPEAFVLSSLVSMIVDRVSVPFLHLMDSGEVVQLFDNVLCEVERLARERVVRERVGDVMARLHDCDDVELLRFVDSD